MDVSVASFDKLAWVFGPDSSGDDAYERARTSGRLFVRSQDHVALFRMGAKGRVLTAWEALDAFGLEVLEEAVEYGVAILVCAHQEPSRSLRKRRKALGLGLHDVAVRAGVDDRDVSAAESSKTRTPIRIVERIAMSLGLDERRVSVVEFEPGADPLAVRLKELGTREFRGHPARSVGAFTDAAWVIATQIRLERWLGIRRELPRAFEPSSKFGSPGYPAWMHGYFLARRTREILGMSPSEPILSLREVVEDLGIPVIQSPLPNGIAGATLSVDGGRGVVLSTVGPNENVWVRRATLAHEMCHLLWDPDQVLKSLLVDDYRLLSEDPSRVGSNVEARANAFAVAFLAPSDALAARVDPRRELGSQLRGVMEEFGLSFTAARYHVFNALERRVNFGALNVNDTSPTAEWKGRESYTSDWHPIDGIAPSRAGRFGGLVAEAEARGLLSEDTAVTYLGCSTESYRRGKSLLRELFPIG